MKLTLFHIYCSRMYTAQLSWNYTKYTITKLQIAYHNILKMFLGMSKFKESTSYLCTLFDIQCCQSVIRILVYEFMCRHDSSVKYIIKGILATSLQYTSRIRKHWCSLLEKLLIVDRTNYIIHIVYNLLHVMLDDNFIIIWTSDCYVLLVCIYYC